MHNKKHQVLDEKEEDESMQHSEKKSATLLSNSKAAKIAANKIGIEQYELQLKQEKHKSRTELLAKRSKHRLDDWLGE